MSILVYKQRQRHPNKKDTPGANYAHVRYIATRPRVMKNENGDHGLFGKMEPGPVTEFQKGNYHVPQCCVLWGRYRKRAFAEGSEKLAEIH